MAKTRVDRPHMYVIRYDNYLGCLGITILWIYLEETLTQGQIDLSFHNAFIHNATPSLAVCKAEPLTSYRHFSPPLAHPSGPDQAFICSAMARLASVQGTPSFLGAETSSACRSSHDG